MCAHQFFEQKSICARPGFEAFGSIDHSIRVNSASFNYLLILNYKQYI